MEKKSKGVLIVDIIFSILGGLAILLALFTAFEVNFAVKFEHLLANGKAFNLVVCCMIIFAVCAAVIVIVNVLVDDKQSRNNQSERRRRRI